MIPGEYYSPGEKFSPRIDPMFTPWKKHFAWREVETISGKKVWLRYCYKRTKLWTSSVTRGEGLKPYHEYATAFDLLGL